MTGCSVIYLSSCNCCWTLSGLTWRNQLAVYQDLCCHNLVRILPFQPRWKPLWSLPDKECPFHFLQWKWCCVLPWHLMDLALAAVRLLNVQQTGCHVDCGTGFFRWMNKNIDYVKVIKKMDYKLFVLKEQNRNEMIVLIWLKMRKRVTINTKSINNNNKIALHCFLLVVQFLACRCSITCIAEHV